MPFTEKQLQHWYPISKSLKAILMNRCYEAILAGDFPSSMRPQLHKLVSQAMLENSEEESIFMQAFIIYANQLDKQQLSASQYAQAIKQFYKIPVIHATLEQLQAHIILQAQLTMLSEGNTAPGESRPLRDSGSFSSCSTYIDSDIIDGEDRSPSLSSAFDEDIFSSPADSSSSIENLKIDISLETVHASINMWVYERFSPVDERVLSSNERHLRRMDSLARLLSLRTAASACTAVTLNLTGEPHIIIGANVGKNGDQDTIFANIAAKLAVIQDHLRAITASDISQIDSTELDYLADSLVSKLLTAGSTSQPPEVLQQAARKIIHAVCIDDETFSAAEKMIFLSHSATAILLPALTDTGYWMQVRQINRTGDNTNSAYPLCMVPKSTGVHNIHAEQLIVRYLYDELDIQTSLVVGINKLCCLTCFESLSHYPVSFRGHHNQEYEGVVDLRSGSRHPTSSIRHAPTHSWPSPLDTPDRRTFKRRTSAEEDDEANAALSTPYKLPSKLGPRGPLFDTPQETIAAKRIFSGPRANATTASFFRLPPHLDPMEGHNADESESDRPEERALGVMACSFGSASDQ